MTDWWTRLASGKRQLLVFWLLNAAVLLALLVFALR
jgi:hypothetical protein